MKKLRPGALPKMWLEDEATWPNKLLAVLRCGLAMLAAYEGRSAEIDEAAQEDVLLRILRPPNEFEVARDEIQAECDVLAREADVVGWHCTWLLPSEAADISLHGLRPLSPAPAHDRPTRAGEGGLLSQTVLDVLRSRNQADHEYRSGQVQLILSTDLLREAEGVYRLLGYWGGEALYRLHEDGPTLALALRSLGQPSLVEMAVLADLVGSYCSTGDRVMRVYLERRGISTDHGGKFAGIVRSAIPAKRILRIIQRPEPEFEALTGCAGWSGRHQI